MALLTGPDLSHRVKNSSEYQLPLPSASPVRSRPLRLKDYPKSLLTRRYARLLSLALFLFTFFFFFSSKSPSLEPVQHYYRCLPHRCVQSPDLVLLPPPYPPTSPLTKEQKKGLPPLFEAWNEYERSLWQHAEDDGTTKFIYMRNHVFASGWGNALQEMILNTHLAYLTGRSFVFDNYTWDRSPSEYSSFNGKPIASRVPVSAMLAGPIIGGSFDPVYFKQPDPLFPNIHSQPHPPFVSSEYYEHVCANETRVVLDTEVVHESVGNWDGAENLKAFVDHIQSFPERCVEFELDAEHVFNIWMFGSTGILSLWPSLAQSPILKQFTYSPLILGAFERNRHLLGLPGNSEQSKYQKEAWEAFTRTPDAEIVISSSRPKKDLYNISTTPLLPSSQSHLPLFPLEQLPSLYPHSPANPSIEDTIPGLLVLHIRRGDFAEHCVNLVEWGASFHGFNSFDDIRERDDFDAAAAGASTPPPGVEPVVPKIPKESFSSRILSWLGLGLTATEKELAYQANLTTYVSAKKGYDARKAKYETAKANYLERCFPDIQQMVKRVRQVREDVTEAARYSSDSSSSAPTAPLTHLYIMTNGKPPFLADLRAALEADTQSSSKYQLPPWESIHTSRDLELGWEERYVAQTIDIYVAQRAEVFVGNGFSSLTSNVVMLRKAHGVDSVKTRLW
ncbi:hypothetical protein GYMLUDRAFT_75051 [Collybiopsis luxurians FD-317 M1]|uniref:Uncharacterized protein n=1 Tax=Collybiopsis luxurians FD-317 M1 TaxID=944289 RepID=A0A0D0B4P8_9AGAR|nr:hypothetical protein GYMLUDRAFT_75051 [Collybiopsis luxurians FD-317 M1]